jgi:hypothetical protein
METEPLISHWDRLSRWERAERGRALRRLGLSYGEIMELIPVPKGTLAGWCRAIVLTPEQQEAIRARTGSWKGVPRDTQRKRRAEIERIRADAEEEVSALIQEPLWLAGTVMYWAEGGKTRNSLRMTNSDPSVLRLFIRWVATYLAQEPSFVLHLHLHEGNDDSLAKSHWESELGLNGVDFYKTYIKPRGTGHRKNHLPWGICNVRLRRSADAWIRTSGWVNGLSRVFGQRPSAR